MEMIYEKAKANPQKVIFPEATEEKILLAALEAHTKGYVKSTLIGVPDEIKAAAEQYGIDISPLEIYDNTDEAKNEAAFEKYIAEYSDMLSLKSLKRKSKDPMYTAMVLQCIGEYDVTFAGLSHTTGDVILAATTIIGLKEGIDTSSSTGLAIIPGFEGSEGQYLLFGDSAVCADPTPSERASIAISACETVKELFGWEPRCAMLSFSTEEVWNMNWLMRSVNPFVSQMSAVRILQLMVSSSLTLRSTRKLLPRRSRESQRLPERQTSLSGRISTLVISVLNCFSSLPELTHRDRSCRDLRRSRLTAPDPHRFLSWLAISLCVQFVPLTLNNFG